MLIAFSNLCPLILFGYLGVFLFMSNGNAGYKRVAAFAPNSQRKRYPFSRSISVWRDAKNNNGEKLNAEQWLGEVTEDLSEQLSQKDLDTLVEEDASPFGFTLSNFDESQIPIPLFTAGLILLGSLYVTGYGFYVGINGFPDDNALPSIF